MLNMAVVFIDIQKVKRGYYEITASTLFDDAAKTQEYEITNALLYKKLSLSLIKTSLSTIYSMQVKFVPLDNVLAAQTVEIAFKNKITFYDACFLSLAKKIKGELVTDNIKHQRKNIENIKVIELKDF